MENERKTTIFDILIVLGLLTITINFIRNFMGISQNFYFQDLLNFLIRISNQTIEIPILQMIQINADWGIFDGIRILINTFSSVLSIILYIGQLLINVAIFIANIIGILFT